MPNGISFVATQHKSNTHGISSDETQHNSNGLTAFIPLQKHQQSNAYSISSSKTRLQSVCLSAFLPKNKKTATPGLEQALRIRISNATKF